MEWLDIKNKIKQNAKMMRVSSSFTWNCQKCLQSWQTQADCSFWQPSCTNDDNVMLLLLLLLLQQCCCCHMHQAVSGRSLGHFLLCYYMITHWPLTLKTFCSNAQSHDKCLCQDSFKSLQWVQILHHTNWVLTNNGRIDGHRTDGWTI